MNHPLNLMIDLETFGQDIGSAIMTIGAIGADKDGIDREFYTRIDLKSCQEAGLKIDADTVYWWLGQSDAAREEISKCRKANQLVEALADFAIWIAHHFGENVKVWSLGASFDIPMLAHAYRSMNMVVPWKFWNERCFRTLRAMYPEIKNPATDGIAHNSLDDARSQYRHMNLILDAIASKA